MPAERTIRRQEPASCESCRKKKLRCDRGLPCHNCQTRSVPCEYAGRRPGFEPSLQHSTSGHSLAALESENAAIKARLRKLEEAIFHGAIAESSSRGPSAQPQPHCNKPTAIAPPTPHASPSEQECLQAYTADSKWLERIVTFGTGQLPYLSKDLCIEVLPLAQITNIVASEVLAKGTLPLRILLPEMDQALHFFNCYNISLHAVLHVFDAESVKATIKSLYAALNARQMPSLSSLIILFAVLGSDSGFWALGTPANNLFGSQQEALVMSKYWLRCALDVSEQSWRTTKPDLEYIQGTILLLFLLYHMEGFNSQSRHLHMCAIAAAKEIGLFVTDSPHRKLPEETQAQIVEAEMRRRVMWHLASTDWNMSCGGNPDDGTYSIHPEHLQVKKPRNLNDEDLRTKPANFSRPESEVTAATYYLQRIKLGEICLEVANLMRRLNVATNIEDIPYEEVLELDTRLADLLDRLPPSMRITHMQTLMNEPMDTQSIHLCKHGLFTYMTVNARRAKLHLPFLLRAQHNPRYRHSRHVCLESARKVLEMRLLQQTGAGQMTYSKFSMLGLLCHFFSAIMVLVMDVCVNDRHDRMEERKAEIREAQTILEEAKSTSRSAALYLDALMVILRKYKVCELGGDPHIVQLTEVGVVPPHDVERAQIPVCTFPELVDLDFEGIWQNTFTSELDGDQLSSLFGEADLPVG